MTDPNKISELIRKHFPFNVLPPTIDEALKALGNAFKKLEKQGDHFVALGGSDPLKQVEVDGETALDALFNLFLALHE